MRTATIDRIDYRTDAAGELLGRSIDLPSQGQTLTGSTIAVHGWVLGRHQQVVAVEATLNGERVARCRPRFSRPDVASAYPDASEAATSGYCLQFPFPASGVAAFEMGAVLADGRCVPIATLRASRTLRASSQGPPLVSIIIPCYRQAHSLPAAIESALRQSYPHIEIVVIDDGSPDNTLALAARYPAVCAVRQETQGFAAARNRGIRQSVGDFLMFLDANDRLLPDAIQSGLRCFEESPHAAFALGQLRMLDSSGQPCDVSEIAFQPTDLYAALLAGRSLGSMGCILFRRSAFERVIGFSEEPSLRGAEGYDLAMRVAAELPTAHHSDAVVESCRPHTGMDTDTFVWSAVAAHRRQRRRAGTRPEWVEAFHAGAEFFRSVNRKHAAAERDRLVRAKDWLGIAKLMLSFASRDPRGSVGLLLSAFKSADPQTAAKAQDLGVRNAA